MSKIAINIDGMKSFVKDGEIDAMQPEVSRIHEGIENGNLPGNDSLGWLHLPSKISRDEIEKLNMTAVAIKEDADIFIVVGIGGSYLGAKAALGFMKHTFYNQLSKNKRSSPEIYFAGFNLSADYIQDLLDLIEDKSVYINVISKSGGTIEPASAFRLLKGYMEKRYGKAELKKRIVVTTDREKGALRKMAEEEGYLTMEIPRDIGGRYSVLTPVGLLPIAVSGVDIEELIEGARALEGITSDAGIKSNPSYLYAVLRNIMYKKGKSIEILATSTPSLHFVAEWWKQLAGESEGKDKRGIYPASVEFTTDLHSLGQWIQDGSRIIFETFMNIGRPIREITIPTLEDDVDGLNYVAEKSMGYLNDRAYEGVRMAHSDGGVPNMTITVKDRSPYSMGQIFYFFEKAIAMSGHLLGVNPFNQPGVEYYKKNMFALLGKPGFERK